MRKQLDNFLLGALWFFANVLGASFWFNARFGFDLFSGDHWRYFGTVQASNTPIAPGFYISLIVSVAIFLVGLYLIVRPRFRKIKLITQTPETLNIKHETPPPPATATTATTSRPPRLMSANTPPPPPPALAPVAPVSPAVVPQNFDQLEKIFTDAGYVTKSPQKISGLKPALFAIGPGEILWIGAAADDGEKLVAAVEKMRAVFADTLEDIPIDIHAFTIGAKVPQPQYGMHIQEFDDVQDLREFINKNPAEKIPDQDRENFDAYSEYIDTVIGYLGKL